GLVHRDVKPSNILLADNDFAYLIDFGIARAAGAALTSEGSTIGRRATWQLSPNDNPHERQRGSRERSRSQYLLPSHRRSVHELVPRIQWGRVVELRRRQVD